MLAALLALAACDSNGPDVTAFLSADAFEVDAPDVLRLGESYSVPVTLTNTTDADLYLGRPHIQLYVQPETPFSPDGRADAAPVLAFSTFQTQVLQEAERIRPGERKELTLVLDLRAQQLYQWSSPPSDGTYVVGATLYTTPGDKESLYRGAEAPDEVSFSAPFQLSFAQ